MDILCKMRVFRGFKTSMDFDIVRYVSIFLTYFGHNLGTSLLSKSAIFPFCVASPLSELAAEKIRVGWSWRPIIRNFTRLR
jgi:hypothetical protein